MSRLFDILQLESNTIESLALDVEPIRQNIGLTRMVKENIRTLESIQRSSLTSSMGGGISSIDFEIITDKLRAYAADRSTVSWSNIEIQALTFHLMSFDKLPNLFHLALTVIKENWRSTYINGLVYSLLNGWHDVTPVLRQECCVLLQKKLIEYKGRIPKYMKLREHTDFFEEVGPIRVSALLLTNGLPIFEAPSILDMSRDMLSLSFFSDVIISYIQSQEIDFEIIENLLTVHPLDRTKKLVLAYLIEQADKTNDPIHQAWLCKWSRDVMGYDVTLESVWTFTGASKDEILSLKNCHKLVKTWYAKRTVETFFELACQDQARRDFWLNYVSHITNFKIVGTYFLRYELSKDARVAETLASCFIEIIGTPYSTAALVLYIRDRIFVEFSDMGALYVYYSTHKAISNISTLTSINKIGDIKTPTMNNLIMIDKKWDGSKEYVHFPEGRLLHSKGWQVKVKSWLREVLHILPSSKNGIPKSKQVFISSRLFDPNQPQKKRQVKSDKIERSQAQYKSADDLKGYCFVRTLFASDEIVKDKLRIVASFDGYCLHIISSQYFYVIEKKLHKGNGAIRISDDEIQGYHEVFHKWEGKTFTICFIKVEKNTCYVKKFRNTSPYRISF